MEQSSKKDLVLSKCNKPAWVSYTTKPQKISRPPQRCSWNRAGLLPVLKHMNRDLVDNQIAAWVEMLGLT